MVNGLRRRSNWLHYFEQKANDLYSFFTKSNVRHQQLDMLQKVANQHIVKLKHVTETRFVSIKPCVLALEQSINAILDYFKYYILEDKDCQQYKVSNKGIKPKAIELYEYFNDINVISFIYWLCYYIVIMDSAQSLLGAAVLNMIEVKISFPKQLQNYLLLKKILLQMQAMDI